MKDISIIKLKKSDKKYFSRWWRNRQLLKLTSGKMKIISENEVDKYFSDIISSKHDYHFLIQFAEKVIGHISLSKRPNRRYETQIIIGESKYWGKGYGPKAIKLIVVRAKKLGLNNIYLEVRPDNIRAIKAYKKCGFVEVKVIKHLTNNCLPETLRMELKLK